jgi:hypothetical protein
MRRHCIEIECEYAGGVEAGNSDSDYKPGDLDWETDLIADTYSLGALG